MGTCFLYGNGGSDSLRFRVYAATSLPASGKENDVVIITSTPIAGWEVFPVAPTWGSANGHVYIQNAPAYNGDYPNVNILKKYGAIWLYLVRCWQYENGTWSSKDAYQYRGGQWVPLHPSAEYLIKDGVIDMTAHPATVTENSGDNASATNGVTYNNKPALRMTGRNGRYCTHSFANVAVPAWATVFYVEIYYIPAYKGDPGIGIVGSSKAISRGSSDRITNTTVSIDVSSSSGSTGTLRIRFQGCSYNDVCYIGNAWFE